MIASIPRRKLTDAILDGCGGAEIDVAGEVVDVGIGRRDVAGLHRQQLPFGLASQFLLEDRHHPRQFFRLVVADIVDAPRRST